MPTEYSGYSSIVSETTPAASLTAKMLPNQTKCYILPPEIILQARVNLASAVYPIGEIPFDTVTVGTFDYALAGMTYVIGSTSGGNDLGRGRLRLNAISGTLYVGRSSRGVREGEVTATDNAYITVYNLFGVHSKQYYINTSGTTYKDGYLAYTDQNSLPPPVSNCGAPFVGTIDKVTGLLECTLTGAGSYATADGATISSYLWDVGTQVIISGTITSSTLVVTFQPGFYWVSLKVTDSNGKTHTARTFIYAHDSDFRTDIQNFQISNQKITQIGQEVSVKVYDDLSLATYIEGTIIVLWSGQPVDSTDHDNIEFWGYLYGEPIVQESKKTGVVNTLTLECRDVAGMLSVLSGRSLIVENESLRDTAENASPTWEYMTTPNLDKYIHYILNWHSTALEVTDFFWSTTGATYKFSVLGSEAQSLWAQAQQRTNAFVPDKILTCNRLGQISMLSDPMLQEVANRTATEQVTINLDSWSNVSYTRQTKPFIHWLHGDAIRTNYTTPESYFSIAPGDAPGQGETAQQHSEQLAVSQDTLNKVTGHRYARINAPQSKYQITLLDPDILRIEPADMTWIRVIVGAANRTPGSTYSNRGLVHEVNINHEYTATGLIRNVSIVWEKEVSGATAITYIPPVAEPVDESTILPDWPVTDTTSAFYGDPGAYVMWSGGDILRTFNIMDTSPVWEVIDTGIIGGIIDIRYMSPTTDSVGAWALCIDGVYVCMDLLSSSPTWSLVLAVATVISTEVAASSGTIEFKCMAPYASEPGYLIVTTGPDIDSSVDLNYNHSYFWHTHDYGATWTTIDAGASLQRTVAGYTHSYCYTGAFGMEMMRGSPTVLAYKGTPRYGLNWDANVCISTDGGHTWAKTAATGLSPGWNNTQDLSILHPFPSTNRVSYATSGDVGASAGIDLFISENLWSSATLLFNGTGGIVPTGLADYGGISCGWRVNKRSNDNNHIIAWFHNEVTLTWHIMESINKGVSWASLYDSGLTSGDITNLPGTMAAYVSPYQTPNGWPPQDNTWFIVKNKYYFGLPTTTIIRMTVDNFATTLDKTGNLSSVLPGGWTRGPANGFALPKVGVNT